MSNEEANQILKELYEVRPEKLNDKAKRLFEAIMTIADERDSVKADLYEANNRINDLLDIAKQKDKEIEELKVINQMQKYRIEVIDERELISKDKLIELREIDNIDLIQCKLRKLLEE